MRLLLMHEGEKSWELKVPGLKREWKDRLMLVRDVKKWEYGKPFKM